VSFISDHPRRLLPLILGVVTLIDVAMLLVQDAAPRLFPALSHKFLAAFSLAAIAFAYLILQFAQRRAFADLAKAILLAAAFLFWAANQFWPNLPQAALFNDIAIALFVLDVFFVIVGWPPASKDSVFAEGDAQSFGAQMKNLRHVDASGRFTDDELKGR
jgi:hypothetical protein